MVEVGVIFVLRNRPVVRCNHQTRRRTYFKLVALGNEITYGEYGLVAHLVVEFHTVLTADFRAEDYAVLTTSYRRITRVLFLFDLFTVRMIFVVCEHTAVGYGHRYSVGHVACDNSLPIGVVSVVRICITLRSVGVFNLVGLDGDFDIDRRRSGYILLPVYVGSRIVNGQGLRNACRTALVAIGFIACIYVERVVLRIVTGHRKDEFLEVRVCRCNLVGIIVCLVHVVDVTVEHCTVLFVSLFVLGNHVDGITGYDSAQGESFTATIHFAVAIAACSCLTAIICFVVDERPERPRCLVVAQFVESHLNMRRCDFAFTAHGLRLVCFNIFIV